MSRDLEASLNNDNSSSNSKSRDNSYIYLVIAHAISSIYIGIKIYLAIRIWLIFSTLDFTLFIKPFTQDDFFRSIVTFLNKTVASIGIGLLVLEIICQIGLRFFSRYSNFDEKRKIQIFQVSCFSFAFVIGFMPEVFFKSNNIDITRDANILVKLFIVKTNIQIYVISVLICCLIGFIFIVCFSRGEYTGTTKETRIYNTGRESVSYHDHYAADTESACSMCFLGMGCGSILIISLLSIFPFVMGIFTYLYNLWYVTDLTIRIFFISEFVLNILYVHFYCESIQEDV